MFKVWWDMSFVGNSILFLVVKTEEIAAVICFTVYQTLISICINFCFHANKSINPPRTLHHRLFTFYVQMGWQWHGYQPSLLT